MVLQQFALILNQISRKLSYHLYFITDFANKRKEESKPPEPPKQKGKNEETEPNFES